MKFILLTENSQLNDIDIKSNSKIQVIFKHSTQCSVSRMANKILNAELKDMDENTMDIYYLDLLAFKNISANIATRYNVEHESPQILVIKSGKCIYSASHSEVSLTSALYAINTL